MRTSSNPSPDLAFRLGWLRYYAGRALQLLGMLVVTGAMALFFGSTGMRPMLAATGVGGAIFILGWLLAKRKPEGAR